MEKEEALKIVSQICASVKLTLQEHQAVQTAIQELTKAVNSLKALLKAEPVIEEKKK